MIEENLDLKIFQLYKEVVNTYALSCDSCNGLGWPIVQSSHLREHEIGILNKVALHGDYDTNRFRCEKCGRRFSKAKTNLPFFEMIIFGALSDSDRSQIDSACAIAKDSKKSKSFIFRIFDCFTNYEPSLRPIRGTWIRKAILRVQLKD